MSAAGSSKGDGRLDTDAPESEEAADRFVYDPRDPVPTLGGSTCCSEDITPVSMGPRDQAALAGRRGETRAMLESGKQERP